MARATDRQRDYALSRLNQLVHKAELKENAAAQKEVLKLYRRDINTIVGLIDKLMLKLEEHRIPTGTYPGVSIPTRDIIEGSFITKYHKKNSFNRAAILRPFQDRIMLSDADGLAAVIADLEKALE